MKYNFTEDIEEEYIPKKVKSSGNKIFISNDEFNQEVQTLLNSDCNYKNIFGYISVNDNKTTYIKFNKDKDIYVVYYYKNNSPVIIYSCIKTWRDYYSNMYTNEKYPYTNEIPAMNS